MIKLLVWLLALQSYGCFILEDEFTYCEDTKIIDFSGSCSASKPTCVDQLDYLKSFLNFRDYYVRPSGDEKIYHSYNGFIYYTDCYKVGKVWVHSMPRECTVDIKVNFIDKVQHNMTAYLTKAMILRSFSTIVQCSQIEEYSRFSLAHRSDQLLRHKNHVKKVNLGILSKPFTMFEKEKKIFEKYKSFFLNNMEFSFIINIFVFAVMIIVSSSLALFNKKFRNKILDFLIKKIDSNTNYATTGSIDTGDTIQVKTGETIITLEYMEAKMDEIIKLNREECMKIEQKMEKRSLKANEQVESTSNNVFKNEGIELEKLANRIYTCQELKSFLLKYHLDTKGLKDELIERLQVYLKNIYNF